MHPLLGDLFRPPAGLLSGPVRNATASWPWLFGLPQVTVLPSRAFHLFKPRLPFLCDLVMSSVVVWLKRAAPSTWFERIRYFRKDKAESEQPKIVIATKQRDALRLCAYHSVPIATSTAIIVINFRRVFIGQDFDGPIKSETINLLFLQLAAKANEICIVASLGLIVLHAVRNQLLFGDGLPLGLVGSGLSFSSFQMFFQKEFWAAVRFLAWDDNSLSKFAFVSLLITSTITATLAGPASATMLVPQSQDWPAGGTDIFLEGANDHYWASELSASDPALQRLCTGENSTEIALCPAGGYMSLWQRWGQLNYTNLYEQSVQPYAKELSGSRTYWPLTSPGSLVPPLYTLGNLREGSSGSWFVQPHAATAVLLEQITRDWWRAISSRKGPDPSKIDDRAVSARVPSPIADVRCGPPQNLTGADKTIEFPTILGRFGFEPSAPYVVDDLNDTAVDHLRLRWIFLPDRFGASSVAAIFESPWTTDNSSRTVVGCSAQSGWVPTDVQMNQYAFWSGWYPWNITFADRKPAWTDPGRGNPIGATNGRIKFSDDFLDLLTPRATISQLDRQLTTIESILTVAGLSTYPGAATMTQQWVDSDTPGQGRSSLLEAVISNVLVDGLSRYGVQHVFDTSGEPSKWALNSYNPRPDFQKRLLASKTALVEPDIPASGYTTVGVKMSISGFAYLPTLATYLSLGVLLTHILMAVIHILWILRNRKTSRCWASVSELIALAQNSRPAFGPLQNTGAGIKRSSTFAQVAKIRVRSHPGDPEQKHVELVFDGSEEPLQVRRFSHRRLSSVPGDEEVQRGRSPASSHSRTRQSATWPQHSSKLSVQTDVSVESRSTSTAPLFPKPVYLADDERCTKVEAGKAYG